MARAFEYVNLTVKPGAEERLLQLRSDFVAQVDAHYPGQFEATLVKLEDGQWLDIWNWDSREVADDALSDVTRYPAMVEWDTLVSHDGPRWGEVLETR